MKFDDAKLLSKAILYHIEGDLDLAEIKYRCLLDRNSKNTEVLFHLSICLWDAGRIGDAIKSMKSALIENQKNIIWWYLLFLMYCAQDNIHKAKEVAKSAVNFGHIIRSDQVKIEDTITEKYLVNAFFSQQYFFIVWINQKVTVKLTSASKNVIALSYSKLGANELAIKTFVDALKADPKNANLLSNYGLLLKNSKNYKDAINILTKAVKIDRTSANIYNNLAVSYEEVGEVEKAAFAYKKALKNEQKTNTIFLNHLSLCTQLESIDELFKPLNMKLNEEFKYLILKAIRGLISGDFDTARNCLNHIHARKIDEIIISDPIERKFLIGYLNFVKALLPQLSPVDTGSNILYHLGESHCLSFSQQRLSLRGIVHQIKPMITFGAKAYHFTGAANNKFKAITEQNLQKTPMGSPIALSFGEIDCRSDEGFIMASRKMSADSKDLIKDVVSKYVGWFEKFSDSREIHFFNLPAPTYKSQISHQLNHEVALNILTFNEHLLEICARKKFSVIDLYSKTKADNCFSNGKYHVDDYHIGPAILDELKQ
jgi:tetratricopeptide (TPR) repeat protein